MSAFVPDGTEDAATPVEAATADPAATPTAAERLAASRERLREWMLDADGGRGARRRRAQAAAEAGGHSDWLDRLRDLPGLGVVIDAISAWWSSHPLAPVASLAQGLVSDRVAPVVRRHPAAVLLGAFLVGVAAVRFRPWRWLAKPALFAGLGSQVIAHLLSSLPLESLFDAVGAFSRRREGPEDEGPPRPEEPSAPPVPQAAVQAETVTP